MEEVDEQEHDGDLGISTTMYDKMRIRDDDDDRTVLSKKLSYVLRHGAKQLDLNMDDEGNVRMSDLLLCGEVFAGVPLEALMKVAEDSNRDKQRYEITKLDDGEWLIRATGKHTMQGLAKSPIKSVSKAWRGKGKGPGSPSNSSKNQRGGGGGGGGARQISEDDFCAKWSLDRLARLRLAELPPSTKQKAMETFNPGPQVPASDYPKVFVAFCKRFHLRTDDDELQHEATVSSPSAKSTKNKKKPSKSTNKVVNQQSGMPAAGLPPNFVSGGKGRIEASFAGADRAEPADYSCGDLFPAYPSPGCTPRSSLDGETQSPSTPVLSPLRQQQMAMSSPMSPSSQVNSPQFARSPASPPRAPPPLYAPDAALGAAASLVPPPPSHAPLVYQDDSFEDRQQCFPQPLPPGPCNSGSSHSGYHAEQEELLRLGPPGHWTSPGSPSRYSHAAPTQVDPVAFQRTAQGNTLCYEVRGTVPWSNGWQVPVGSQHGQV